MITIINDLHLGCNRVGGTTPASREALSEFQFAMLDTLLAESSSTDLVIHGDLFDAFEVAPRDWLRAYIALSGWCLDNKDNSLFLVAGNHDVSLKGNKVSSFETLSEVLSRQFDNVGVVPIDDVYQLNGCIFLVAHHRNQEIFDMHLAKVCLAVREGDYVFLHANYANPHAEVADHSLNVSEEVARDFANKGVTLVFAHEHQHRIEIPHGADGDCAPVVVLGNQIPTSVSDCLGGGGVKYYWTISRGGLEKHECWSSKYDYGFAQVDWRSLTGDYHGFVRVVGDATNAEAAQVIDAISKFRQKSPAFIVSNAVKIEGIADLSELPETFEAAKRFDVLEFVYKQLDDAESAVIRGIVEKME